MTLESLKNRLKEEVSGSPVQREIVWEVEKFKLTIKELKSAIASNPDHPVCESYAKAVATLGDDQEVVVDKPDLEALIQNCEIEIVSSTREEKDGTVTVCSKRVGKGL